jgi:hypothetical protein
VDPRNLIEEEEAMRNYPLNRETKQSIKKMKRTISKKKCKSHNSICYSDDSSSSQDDLLGSTRNVRKRQNCNKQ